MTKVLDRLETLCASVRVTGPLDVADDAQALVDLVTPLIPRLREWSRACDALLTDGDVGQQRHAMATVCLQAALIGATTAEIEAALSKRSTP